MADTGSSTVDVREAYRRRKLQNAKMMERYSLRRLEECPDSEEAKREHEFWAIQVDRLRPDSGTGVHTSRY